jgi:hypothetical protein
MTMEVSGGYHQEQETYNAKKVHGTQLVRSRLPWFSRRTWARRLRIRGKGNCMVRVELVLAAAKHGDFSGVKRLLKIYDDADWMLSTSCAELMGDIGNRQFF